MKTLFFWLLIGGLFAPAHSLAQTKTAAKTATSKPETLTNASVISLHKAGLEDEIILAKIESSQCKFDLTTNGLIALKNAGLSKVVISAMQGKSATAAVAPSISQPEPAKPAPGTGGRAKIPDLETINAVHLYDPATGSAKPLERAQAKYKLKTVAFGYGGAKFVYEFDGKASPVRLASGTASSFIVNTGGGAGDGFVLYKVETRKASRQAITDDRGPMGTVNGSKGVIALDIKQLKPGIYELTPTAKLEKGEYVFLPKGSFSASGSTADVYAFGID